MSVLPLVVSAIGLVVKVGGDYAAGSDIGLTELRTLDVGRHPVLLGPYSRDGWNHPGPALFYALTLPYRLAGSHSVGLAVGALLINALAITGIALVATPPEERDPRLSETTREALLTAITVPASAETPNGGPDAAAEQVAVHAVALRALLTEAPGVLSPAERQLLSVWLDQLATSAAVRVSADDRNLEGY